MTEKDKKELLRKIDDIVDALDDARYEVESFNELVEDKIETDTNLNEWKKAVINNLPDDCSMKFRMDVEEMLEKFKGVY